MRAVVDSSSWISLARSGLLGVLSTVDVEPVLLDVVRDECVRAGVAGGHADAAALETVMDRLETQVTTTAGEDADVVVLAGARPVGVLVTNDLALGRRARSAGLAWLRTADLVVLGARGGTMTPVQARRAVDALRASGRITTTMADDYLEELR